MAKPDIRKIAEVYFDRFSFCEKQLNDPVSENLELIVVIPCYNEENLVRSLSSLRECEIPKGIAVEVITVVNQSENAIENVCERNLKTISDHNLFSEVSGTSSVSYKLIEALNLPKKHAGVGLARKIGMDEALRRLASIGKDGVIVCFDADSLCEKNYFQEIYWHFKKYPKTPGCSIHFEHPVSGDEYSQEVYDAIVDYELHLRYYKNALQYAGLPYAFHTIGSSMAIRASAYAKQGGMNKRKAGEDFYFLNKIIELGNFTELNSTKVIPSPRISDRVPFGTGKAVGEILSSKTKDYLTYNVQSFIDLKQLTKGIFEFNKNIKTSHLNGSIKSYALEEDFEEKVAEINKNTTSEKAFLQRFFYVFNAFWVLKFVHYARDNFYQNQSILNAANELLKLKGIGSVESKEEALKLFRELDLER